MTNLCVLVVAGHSVVRVGLRTLLAANAITVAGEAASVSEAESLAATLQPDIVVLDSSRADADQLATLNRIAKAAPRARIIFLSDWDDEAHVEQALVSGASCYLLRQTASADLFWAIKAAQKGREYFSPALIQRLRDPAATIPEPDQLQGLTAPNVSQLEARLMTMISQGLIIKELAQELRANIETVVQHKPATPAVTPSRRTPPPQRWNILKRLRAHWLQLKPFPST